MNIELLKGSDIRFATARLIAIDRRRGKAEGNRKLSLSQSNFVAIFPDRFRQLLWRRCFRALDAHWSYLIFIDV